MPPQHLIIKASDFREKGGKDKGFRPHLANLGWAEAAHFMRFIAEAINPTKK